MIETERLEHYRGQADLCWQIGARAVDAPDRDAWLLLAVSWNNLANQAELRAHQHQVGQAEASEHHASREKRARRRKPKH
jgi:hypothetical protein